MVTMQTLIYQLFWHKSKTLKTIIALLIAGFPTFSDILKGTFSVETKIPDLLHSK